MERAATRTRCPVASDVSAMRKMVDFEPSSSLAHTPESELIFFKTRDDASLLCISQLYHV